MKRYLTAAVVAATCVLPASAAAETCPNAAIRAQQSSSHLAQCRAYEQVSPTDKNGTSVQSFLRMAGDGEGVAWMGQGAYANAQGSNGSVAYAARRTASGWATTAFSPRYNAGVRPDPSNGISAWALPADFASMTFFSTGEHAADDQDNYPGIPFGPGDVFRVDKEGNSVLLSHGEGIAANGFSEAVPVGVSEDGSTVFFRTAEALTPDQTVFENQLWRWHDGRVEAVGKAPDGTALEGSSWLGAGASYVLVGNGDAGRLPDSAAVSADGSRFVFGGYPAPGSPKQLYLHSDGAPVRQLSISQRTGSAGTPSVADTFFVAVSPGFERIYFQSSDQLSDDAPVGGGLYVYDVGSGELLFSNPDQSPYVSAVGFGFGGDGLVRISDDGARVYFVSPEALAPGAVASARNLYLQQAGGPRRLIAVLSEEDAEVAVTLRDDNDGGAINPDYSTSYLSADGTQLVFSSLAPLTGPQSNGHQQVYLYDAEADRLSCVSCRPGGGLSQGGATLRVSTNESRAIVRPMSADGRTVVFTTADALLPKDSNGVDDVYEYHDGKLSLVSGGASASRSVSLGVSADGVNAYFVTGESLASSDLDQGLRDVYVARVGGGFDESPDSRPSCAGSACQQPQATSPASLALGSTTVVGAANANQRAKQRKSCAKGRRTVRSKGKVRCVKKRTQPQRRQGR